MTVVPMQRNRPEVILTRQELAEELKVSTRTIDRWVKEGLPSEQWGPRIRRFRLQAVYSWLRKRAA